MSLRKKNTVTSKYQQKPAKLFRRVGALVLSVMFVISAFGDTKTVLTTGLSETAAATATADPVSAASETVYDEVASDTYQAPEYMATQSTKRSRPFLNTNPPATGYKDEKEFTILEIIPHDACSYFPYLIDWKTKDGYDDNVPIGYEGLMSVAFGNILRIFHPEKDIITQKEITALQMIESPTGTDPLRMFYTQLNWAGGKETFFSSENDYAAYKVYMGSTGPGNQAGYGKWYRFTDPNAALETADGYFEFVGSDMVTRDDGSQIEQYHGLYYITTTYAKGISTSKAQKGINQQIMAVGRKENEAPQGKYYVDSPAYYWPVDDRNSALPDYYNVSTRVNEKIQSQTDYNYDVAFTESAVGLYRADVTKVKDKAAGGKYPDYFIELTGDSDQINAWTGKFAFIGSGGNLSVAEAQETTGGAYVRVASAVYDDGFSGNGLPKGYFRSFQVEDEETALANERYTVKFAHGAASVPAFYYAAMPSDWVNPGCAFSFIHYSKISADAKGVYDVPFRYDAGLTAPQNTTTRYDAVVRAVKHNSGRYALTSTAKETVGNVTTPVYSDGGKNLPKDYVRGIINIDFVEAAHGNNGNDVDYQAGVSYGGNGAVNPSWGYERGGWVFHPVSDASEMEVTELEEVFKDINNPASNTKFEKGDRIWVYNQKYKQRYYGRDGFRNNELFKLLAYSSNPADTSVGFGTNKGSVGYQWNQTPLWNLEYNSDAQDLLKDFELPDGIGIKIVQRSFDKVSVNDVNDADLIYISRSVGLQGMTPNLWNNTISGASKRNSGIVLPPIDSDDIEKTFGDVTVFKKDGDISEAVLFAIYDACIVKQNTALMMEYNNFVNQNSGTEPNDNLAKLVFLMFAFDNGQKFQYFIDGYPERVDYFSKITKSDAAVTVWPTKPVAGQNETNYNINPAEYSLSTVKLEEETHNQWSRVYFNKAKLPNGTELGEIRNYLGDYANTNMIDDSQTIMGLGEYGPNSLFHSMVKRDGYNLWTILQRRKAKTPSYKVILRPTADSNVEEIKAADGTIEYVLYANEFDENSFEITFEACKDDSVPMENVKLKLDTVTRQFEGGGLAGTSLSVVHSGGDEAYTINVRNGFEVPGSSPPQLDTGVQKRIVLINGADTNGIKGEELKVTVILRDIFSLN